MRDLALMSFSRLPASGDRVADGRPVAGHADFQLVHQVEQQPLVEGERTLGERLVPEDHEADPVPLSLDDEVLHHFFHRRQAIHRIAVDLEVHGAHRAGGVEAEHDVDAGSLGFPRDVVVLRAGGRQHQEREADGAQDQRDPAPDPADAAGHPDQRRSPGVAEAGRFAPQGEGHPAGHGDEQRENGRIGESEHHRRFPCGAPPAGCVSGVRGRGADVRQGRLQFVVLPRGRRHVVGEFHQVGLPEQDQQLPVLLLLDVPRDLLDGVFGRREPPDGLEIAPQDFREAEIEFLDLPLFEELLGFETLDLPRCPEMRGLPGFGDLEMPPPLLQPPVHSRCRQEQPQDTEAPGDIAQPRGPHGHDVLQRPQLGLGRFVPEARDDLERDRVGVELVRLCVLVQPGQGDRPGFQGLELVDEHLERDPVRRDLAPEDRQPLQAADRPAGPPPYRPSGSG